MPEPEDPRPSAAPGPNLREGPGVFRTTHWSLVLMAGNPDLPASSEALERLCRAYWPPVYAFVRRRGHPPHEAEDLTQGFFERMLAKSYLGHSDPDKGRFRTFLITMLTRFLANEWDRTQRLKRGGGLTFVSLNAGEAEERSPIEPATLRTPETEYDRRWAETVLERVLGRLESENAAAGYAERFAALKVFLVDVKGTLPLDEAAARLGLSVPATKSIVHRLRSRYRELLRAEIAETVVDPAEIDQELRHLLTALRATP